MKNKKLNLKALNVKSFVTNNKNDIKGGCPVHTDTIQPCTLPAQCGVFSDPPQCQSALASACGGLQCY